MDEPLAKKSLGQHWLDDVASLEAICRAADIQPDDTVLEIGPGPGSLTKLLVKKAGRVIAVEFDAKLAADLPGRIKADNLEVVEQDILSFDLNGLPADYKIVANIPYYLTSNLIRVISETPNPPTSATILVQKEVAQRVAAEPGAMSILGVTAQFYWQVGLAQVVRAELFKPPPKVDSQVLILKRRPEPLFPDVDAKSFFRLVKAGFAQRRKTLLNSLSAGLHTDRTKIARLLEVAGIETGRRPQTLSLEEWRRIHAKFDES